MDMANAYYYWTKRNFPKTQIVVGHFHGIKLMNEKREQESNVLSFTANNIESVYGNCAGRQQQVIHL